MEERLRRVEEWQRGKDAEEQYSESYDEGFEEGREEGIRKVLGFVSESCVLGVLLFLTNTLVRKLECD